MNVDDFDFELPADRIALRPARPRDMARLLRVNFSAVEELEDHLVHDLPGLLRPGDAVVFNDTKVIPARLTGIRIDPNRTGPRIEVTLHKLAKDDGWFCFVKPARKLKVGDYLRFGAAGDLCLTESLVAKVEEKFVGGECKIVFETEGADFDRTLQNIGQMPLPPYIASKRLLDEFDVEDYQTIFARRKGAIAAPTAGLHFTSELLELLSSRGITHHYLTLHVGAGTFLPVKSEQINSHKMHSEWGQIGEDTAEALNAVRAAGGRVVAIGTTVARLLESASRVDGIICPFDGETDIFIRPGYSFRAVDLLFTNFHLPKSTLFMLVSAFSGPKTMRLAYQHAIRQNYRFYSYGDACLLSPCQ